MSFEIKSDDVLVVVDVQYDFLPGGSLAVADGDAIIPVVNALAKKFANVVLTQDWHPADHVSFASQHAGKAPFETVELDYGTQVLWPNHCVWGTRGAEISADLDIPHAQMIIRKGFNRAIDSYSGFQEADRTSLTGLASYLGERNLSRVFVVGLATDFCVAWTAIDSAAGGFETFVIEDATRAIDANGSLEKAWADLEEAGVTRITSAELIS
ncbi:bifunctional nicotinamidase/pyrazinamidase [Devosia sp. MC521]|uniref:bifunctional nicotinamidase/pyrazinamidase n=1 Tax=Devosia sp. MC521 TaxID=2759954 RepID=UPI0015FC411D|nr:bifunctional nicotinamidase/pyrazinamidase [Devosia sp. MC521]MBJ6988541.1 bifunctional nicotinamidase/pyrazinamidase [Devosia sp. MC521]QMW62653.1 bifunctional nicotinamidase/pyrazinamidase [Devosia sp. MC521]